MTEILDLEGFLPYRLNRLADMISREFANIYRDRHGLTRPEWRLLATLGQYGRMTATAVGAHSAMHKTKVSRAVAELERRLWLKREQDAGDRRIEHLTLSAAGARAYRELVPLMKEHERKLLGRASVEQREAITRAIDDLERAMAG